MSERRTLTFAACDGIAQLGKKPSISSVREWTVAKFGKRQGSDTDVQGDINAWFRELLALKQEILVVEGLPNEVAALARALWLKANEAAAEALENEKTENAALVERANQVAKQWEIQAGEAHDRADALGHERDIGQEAIKRLEEALFEMRSTAAAVEERHAGQLQARDERITALIEDFARKEKEYAQRITELDGVRKHALLQIEQARTESRHWNDEFKRVDQENKSSVVTYRQKSSSLEERLATANGRAGILEEMMAKSQKQVQALERELSELKAKQDSKKEVPGTRRFIGRKVRGNVPPRKL